MPNPVPPQLKPFVKNDPRRINKPKGAISMSTMLKHYLESTLKQSNPVTGINGEKLTAKQIIVLKTIAEAMKGDPRFVEMVFDRIEGKPKQDTTVTVQRGKFEDLATMSDEEVLEKVREMQ